MTIKEENQITKENKERKITIRLTDEDYVYLQCIVYQSGLKTVSKYMRTLLDASINAVKLAEKQGKVNIEDIKAIFND